MKCVEGTQISGYEQEKWIRMEKQLFKTQKNLFWLQSDKIVL